MTDSADQSVYPDLIHVRRTKEVSTGLYEFRVSHFCFINNDDFSGRECIISKGSNDDNLKLIKVILENCSFDCIVVIKLLTFLMMKMQIL